MNLRPYQIPAVQAVYRELHYRPSTLVCHPTGSGKTHLMAATARVWRKRHGSRILSLAPRDELLDQAERAYRAWMPDLRPKLDIGREAGNLRANPSCQVVLASLQSLHPKRLSRAFAPDHFGAIIVDEAHLFLDGLERIAEHFRDAKRIGFSATPDRSDGRPLMPGLFESLADLVELRDLGADPDFEPQSGRYLCPLRFRRHELPEIDIDGVPMRGLDFDEPILQREMMRPAVVRACCGVILQEMEARPTLVFCVRVEHAEAVAADLNRERPGIARVVTAETPNRAELFADFQAGKFQILVSVVLCSYGLDIPCISHVVFLRPTGSRNFHSQGCGRGTRLLGATYEESCRNGKADCLITDVVGNTLRHRLITPQHVLEPLFQDTAPRPRRAKAAPDGEEEVQIEPDEDLEADLFDAFEPVEATAAVSVSGYRVVEVDNQLSVVGIDVGRRFTDDPPATLEQRRMLRELGIERADGLSEDQAEKALDGLQERARRGWCTYLQARYLQMRGLNPNLTFAKASAAIEQIRDNGGRLPSGMSGDETLIYQGEEVLSLKGVA